VLYDPAANAVTYTGTMHTAHFSHTASLLFSRDVLIAGGVRGVPASNFPGIAEIYAPSTGTWTVTGAMHTSRQNHTATVLENGTVLVAGGENYCDDDGCTTTNSAEIYNPKTGAWTYTNSMRTYREGAGAVLLQNGRALIAGGENSFGGPIWATAEQYVP
jgi:N-acetylneuraminic acid mutarotase